MKNTLRLMLAVILACVIFSFGVALGQEKPTVLKLAHINVANGIIDKQAQKFAELMASKTKGRVKVDVYPASQLGTVTEMVEGISMGTISMGLESETMLQMFDKDFSIISVYFLVSKDMLLKNAYINELRERVRVKNNIRSLPGLGWRPPFHLWTQKRLIKTPDELKGIKIRLIQQKTQIDMWNNLGATAVPIPWGETYMALTQGIANGVVHNIVQIEEEKFYEQLNYCTLLDCFLIGQGILINDKVYAGLSPDIQKAMNEAAMEAANYFTGLSAAAEANSRKIMEKTGVKFVEGDRKPWFEKAQVVMKKMENDGAWSKGLLKKVGVD